MRAFSWTKQERGLLLSWLPGTVLLLGLISGSGFWWLNHLNLHHQQFDSLIDVVYDIDRQVSLSHLWFDEPNGAETELVKTLLEKASHSVVVLKKRLLEDKSLMAQNARRQELLQQVGSIQGVLVDLQVLADALLDKPQGKMVAENERRFNRSFQLFSHAVVQIEGTMKDESSAHIRSSLTVFRMIFVGWILLVVVLLVVLLRVESCRLSTAMALADSEEKFRTMAESARDAIVLADAQGRISYWNLAAEKMFGKTGPELMGGKLCDIILPETPKAADQDRCAALWQFAAGGEKDAFIGELEVDSGDGSFPVEVSMAPITLDGKQQNIAIMRDISERKDAEQALRDNESLLRTLINAMPDFVCFKDCHGRWLMANEFGLHLFGLDGVDYRNQNDRELAEYNDFFKPAFLSCIHSDELAWQAATVTRCDEVIPRREGRPLIFDVIKVPLFHDDQSRKGLLVIGRDITERKAIEKALLNSEEQLRHLSASLFVVQETERRRVANELHDELGQALVALKMQVRAMQRDLSDDQPAEGSQCDGICDYINEIIENVRRLSRDLSPVVLDDLGLGAALKHMIDNFSELYDIDASLSMAEIGHLLAPGAERIVYRIVQEALTNVAKHAKARNLDVTICKEDGGIRFLIKDDGAGFDPVVVAQKKAAQRGLGLTAMSERVRMLGGLLDIESQPGHGTRISMLVPMHGGS